jgi:hypothetical protein
MHSSTYIFNYLNTKNRAKLCVLGTDSQKRTLKIELSDPKRVITELSLSKHLSSFMKEDHKVIHTNLASPKTGNIPDSEA